MTCKPDYDRGFDDAIKWVVTELHKRARQMNDPRCRDWHNSAAFHIGNANSQRKEISKIGDKHELE